MVRTERPYVFRAKGAAFNFEAGATPQLVELGNAMEYASN